MPGCRACIGGVKINVKETTSRCEHDIMPGCRGGVLVGSKLG